MVTMASYRKIISAYFAALFAVGGGFYIKSQPHHHHRQKSFTNSKSFTHGYQLAGGAAAGSLALGMASAHLGGSKSSKNAEDEVSSQSRKNTEDEVKELSSLCSESQEFINCADWINIKQYVDAGAKDVAFSFYLNGADTMTTQVAFVDGGLHDVLDSPFDIVTRVADFLSNEFWDTMARFDDTDVSRAMTFNYLDVGEDVNPGTHLSKGLVSIYQHQFKFWEIGDRVVSFDEKKQVSVRGLQKQFTETVCNDAFQQANLSYACPSAHLG